MIDTVSRFLDWCLSIRPEWCGFVVFCSIALSAALCLAFGLAFAAAFAPWILLVLGGLLFLLGIYAWLVALFPKFQPPKD